MLSWASSHIERISNAVAPPANDPGSRFVRFCQQGDENGALGVLSELQSLSSPISKGMNALQVACLHSMAGVIRQILHIQHQQQYSGGLAEVDSQGNSALHCACMSTKPHAVDTVKMLVNECQVPVGVKNAQGRTPYDVSSIDSVRQFLLPIQLQQETQTALDNGGSGLIPGMDLGGLKINHSNLAPPPTVLPSAPQAHPPSRYVQPAIMSPPAHNLSHPPQAMVAPDVHTGPNPNDMIPPPVSSMQHVVEQPAVTPGVPLAAVLAPAASDGSGTSASPEKPFSVSEAPAPSETSPEPAPTSGPREYSRSGYSAAAIGVKGASKIWKPDGFHTSSSDPKLQAKYGHSVASYGSALPPPPRSGGPTPSYSAGPPPPNRYVQVDPQTGQSVSSYSYHATTGSGYGSAPSSGYAGSPAFNYPTPGSHSYPVPPAHSGTTVLSTSGAAHSPVPGGYVGPPAPGMFATPSPEKYSSTPTTPGSSQQTSYPTPPPYAAQRQHTYPAPTSGGYQPAYQPGGFPPSGGSSPYHYAQPPAVQSVQPYSQSAALPQAPTAVHSSVAGVTSRPYQYAQPPAAQSPQKQYGQPTEMASVAAHREPAAVAKATPAPTPVDEAPVVSETVSSVAALGASENEEISKKESTADIALTGPEMVTAPTKPTDQETCGPELIAKGGMSTPVPQAEQRPVDDDEGEFVDVSLASPTCEEKAKVATATQVDVASAIIAQPDLGLPPPPMTSRK